MVSGGGCTVGFSGPVRTELAMVQTIKLQQVPFINSLKWTGVVGCTLTTKRDPNSPVAVGVKI